MYVSPFEMINITCTQGDGIYIYIYIFIYINHYDENLLNIFLICCLKSSVTLSSIEAEYVAVSEVYSDIMFIKMDIKHPIVVHCDNVGAIFLGNNAKQSVRTKYIDVRYHFIRKYIVDGMVETVFVPSEENDWVIFTKSVPKEKYEKHTNKFMTNMDTI